MIHVEKGTLQYTLASMPQYQKKKRKKKDGSWGFALFSLNRNIGAASTSINQRVKIITDPETWSIVANCFGNGV